jgi:predicted NUDIX family phosphoesterase
VEEVHIGLVYHFVGDIDEIQINETDKMAGQMFLVEEISKLPHSPWMGIVVNNYIKK